MLNAILLFVFFVSAAAMNEHAPVTSAVKPVACHFFSYENAEKLLGQKVTASDSDESKDGSEKWTCTFTTAAGESGPRIFFVILREAAEETAKSEFQKVRLSNQKNKGFEEWPEVADEALVHTDGKNFQFVMIRKGARTLRIKVGNSGGVSFEELKSVAASLAAKLK